MAPKKKKTAAELEPVGTRSRAKQPDVVDIEKAVVAPAVAAAVCVRSKYVCF